MVRRANQGPAAPTLVALLALASLASGWHAPDGTSVAASVAVSTAHRGSRSEVDQPGAAQVVDAGRYYLPLALRDGAPQEPARSTPTEKPARPSLTPSATPTVAPTSTPAAKPTYSLGVGPPEDVYSGCVVREVIDDLEDGRPDTIYTTTYNALSYKTRIEYDEDADGSAEQVVVFEYDEAGRLVGGFVDDGDDGTVDSAATHIYDEWGRLVQVESDRDGDGVVDWRVTLEYNPRSDLLEMMVDDGADGVPDRIERYSYDAGGHRVREEDDIDGDGEFDFVEDLTWSGGLLVRTVWESVRHGTKYIKMYSWDDSRRLVRRDEDQDGDGVLDRWAVIDYEEHGWLARIEDYQGHLEGFSVYTYDPVGRLLARRDDYVALGMTAISRFTNNCP